MASLSSTLPAPGSSPIIPPIPAFQEYISADIAAALVSSFAVPHPTIKGLAIVGGIPAGFEWLLSDKFLSYLVGVYRTSLGFDRGLRLTDLLTHRKMKRRVINDRARAIDQSKRGEVLRDVVLEDGSIALGYRKCTAAIRDDPKWKIARVPEIFNRFHDTITAAPNAPAIVSGLKSGAHFVMVDFEDSSTVALSSLLEGIKAVTLANQRRLDYTCPTNKTRYTILPTDTQPLAQMSIRIEGLHLPNGHFFVDGAPLPAHLVTSCMYLYHNWQPCMAIGAVPAIYIPKLESYEEAQYFNSLFRAMEAPISASSMSGPLDADLFVPRSLTVFAIIENVFGAYQREEILYGLRDYIAGLNTGWHDYMASIGAVHQCLSNFSMPPKSNLSIVIDYLEAYQVGLVQVCQRRGAIPIGGMNAMMPPAGLENDSDVFAKITTAFSNDFATQTKRGLRGQWLAWDKLAPVVGQLVQQLESSPLPPYVAKPITHERMLVTELKDVVSSEEEFERNMTDALQYLASYLTGDGNVGLTSRFADGSRVKLMEDAATLERSRREVWSIIRYNKPILKKDGSRVAMNQKLAAISLQRVWGRVKESRATETDIPFNGRTKIAYDIALSIVTKLFFDEHPVDYFTVLAQKHLILPFRGDPGLLEKVEKASKLPWLKLPNLSATATVEFTTNEAFAPASSLLKTDFPLFAPHSFAASGQIYDGWETARHNIAPPDHTIIRLAKPSRIEGVNIDTAHFLGNHAVGGSVEGLVVNQLDTQRQSQQWITLVPQSLLIGNGRNFFATVSSRPVSHVKLNMYPDGGIARLELYGTPAPLPPSTDAELEQRTLAWVNALPGATGFPAGFKPDLTVETRPPVSATGPAPVATAATSPFPSLVEVLSLANGGQVLASSSSHYSLPANMLKPTRGINMGDGWETHRNRPSLEDGGKTLFSMTGPALNYNWTVFSLGTPTNALQQLVVDTAHYRNNPPVAFKLEYCNYPSLSKDNYWSRDVRWNTLVAPSRLQPHQEHTFAVNTKGQVVTHVLLKIFPCGGISRIRLYATPPASSATNKAKVPKVARSKL